MIHSIRLVFLCSLLWCSQVVGQTKLIAWKSHSGAMHHFYKAVKTGTFDLSNHNLGMAPQKIVKGAQLDSVIYLDDTTTIMVTSEVCWNVNRPKYSKNVWRAGKDTVSNDTVWNREDPEEIKKELKRSFHFQNNIDSVTFIGFPGAPIVEPAPPGREEGSIIPEDREEVVIPVVPDQKPGMMLPLLIVGVSTLAIFIGLISWRRSLEKQQRLERTI